MAETDNEIIQNIRKGAKHDFALLVDRYKDKAMTLAMRMLRNPEDAEEATQDGFIRAYNALDRFEGSAKFSTWLYRIVYNVCLTKLGKRKEEFREIDYDDETAYPSSGSIWPADSNYESREMVTIIKKVIEELPEKYSIILSLFYFQELSHEEICGVTQLPLGTVKTHLFRARVLLQQRLVKDYDMENASL
jgi:RNA polymerase sigma-70 factor (ECF subfamily)